MRKVILQCAICVLGLTAALSSFAAGDVERGKALFPVCAACHGANGEGNALLNAPVNAGQGDWYIARQLQNFRAGIRGTHPQDTFGMQMRPMAMSLPDDQAVEDVAAYLASLTAPKPAPTLDGDAEAGKVAFTVCVACHAADGTGNKDLNAPALRGQYDWYLVRQIEHFKNGVRGSDPKDMYGMQMKPMAMTLVTDKQIKDVVAYIMTLP